MKRVKLFALISLLFIGLGHAWGENVTITFKTATTDGSTEISNRRGLSTVISAGADYVSGFTSSCSKAYYNGKSGVKLGSTSSAGTLEFNIATAYQSNIKKITIKSAKYGSDTGTLTLYCGSTSLKTGITPGTDYIHEFATPTTVPSIKLVTSSKRAYISEIVLESGSSGGVTYTDVFMRSCGSRCGGWHNGSTPPCSTFRFTFHCMSKNTRASCSSAKAPLFGSLMVHIVLTDTKKQQAELTAYRINKKTL